MASVLTTSASSIGSIIISDAEFSLPTLPYFPPEFLVLPFGETGLLFEGAGSIQVINGRGARAFLPKLLPRLDGKTPVDVLAEAFSGVAARSVVDAIALLYSRGLIEDGFAQTDPADRDLGAFLGRNVDETRANANRGQAIARLAKTRVQVIGTGAFADRVGAALSGSGLHRVIRGGTIDPDEAHPDFVVAAFSQNDPADIEHFWTAWHAGIPIIHAALTPDAVEIGPLFLPLSSACYDCFRAVVKPRTEPNPPAFDPADAGFWAGVVALQVHHVISRVGKVSLHHTCHVYAPHRGRMLTDIAKVARLPGCKSCGLGDCRPIETDPDSIVWRLHNATNSFPPKSLQNPKDYQNHFTATNIGLSSKAPLPWYGTVRSTLPAARDRLGAPAWSARSALGELDATRLSTILRFAFGERPERSGRRLAPSAGGLSSPDVFLVIRDVEGMQPGVYRYDPPSHALDQLRSIPDALLAATIGILVAALPPVIVFATGMTEKVSKKYGDMAFRFAQLDGGVIKLYLHDIATTLGIPFKQYPDVREGALMDALSIPLVACRYIPTFTAGLGASPVELDPAALDQQSYVHDLIELACLPPARPVRRRPPLDTDIGNGRELADIIQQRRAARDFGEQPVDENTLIQIGLVVCNADGALEAAGGLHVRMRLWAAVLDGEQSGPVYSVRQFDQGLQSWCIKRRGVPQDEIAPAVLQRLLSKAPVILFITADFEHAVSHHGARGYREALSRAGSMAARSMLAAEAQGLIACPWGGITDDSWADILTIDRYTDCPMFGVSIGHKKT